jgi:pyruvate, orthophosphate dikinase
VILMRPDTSTADVAGFAVAAGIVTTVGARTAHAALVARQMGKPCIVGCASMTVDVAADRAQLAGTTISGSDWITIDGDGGTIYLGRLDTVETRPEAELAEIASWRSEAADHAHDGHKPKSPHHRARRGSAGV